MIVILQTDYVDSACLSINRKHDFPISATYVCFQIKVSEHGFHCDFLQQLCPE